MFFKTVRDLLNETSPERRGKERRGGEERRRGERESGDRLSPQRENIWKDFRMARLYIAQAHYILHITCINSLTD